MKTMIKLFLSSILIFGLSNCNTTKQEAYQLQKEAPFKIKEATYQEWVAGVRGGGSGISISLLIEDFDTSKIKIDSLYFRNYKAQLSKRGANYVANIKTNLNNQEDIILHKNTQNEYGNQPPVIEDSNPFNLSYKEAIISYKEKNKMKYVKVTLSQKPSPLYQ